MGRKLLFLLGFAALAAVTYRMLGRDFDADLFWNSVTNVRPGWIAASSALTFLGYGIRAVRWQVLLISLKRIRLAPLAAATLLGFAGIYALGRAGELIRPVWIARREGIPVAGSFAAIAVERVFDMLMLLVLFAAGLLLVDLPVAAASTVTRLERAAWLLFLSSGGALGVFVLFGGHIGRLAERIRYRPLARLVEALAAGFEVTREPRQMARVAGCTILVWAEIALQFWLMLVGLSLDFPFPAAILILVVSALGSIAQIPGIGGGFQAGFVFSLTTLFGVPAETAVAASLLAWIVTYAPTLVAASGFMMWKGIAARDLVAGEASLETS